MKLPLLGAVLESLSPHLAVALADEISVPVVLVAVAGGHLEQRLLIDPALHHWLAKVRSVRCLFVIEIIT